MQRILLSITLLSQTLLFPLLSSAQNFSVVKQNPITSVKDQNQSGTCWDYATLGFVESEILRTSGKTYDLCEMFVANKDYMDCATHHVRMHGFSQICEGGSADDVFEVIKKYGICPENAMPAPGSLVGDSLANFNEFRDVYKEVVKYYGSAPRRAPGDAGDGPPAGTAGDRLSEANRGSNHAYRLVNYSRNSSYLK